MINVFPTTGTDFSGWNPRVDEVALYSDFDTHALDMLEQSEDTRTIRAPGGEIIGIVGVILNRPACGSAWALLSERITMHPIETTKVVRKLMELFASTHELRRLDMLVNGSSQRNIKWAKVLGFQEEGILKGFGDNGEDINIMARYWNVRN